MTAEIVFDLVLLTALAFAAYRAIHAPALFAGVVVYIVFGVVLAVVWVRLEAPDLAIAEAAIGAGVTGAMLLEAARQLGEDPVPRAVPRWLRWLVGVLSVAAAALLAGIFLGVGERTGPLPDLVAGSLPESGVEHPITAVLLNFRGYDTWLEVGVLLAASLGILALRWTPSAPAPDAPGGPPAIATGAAALLTPVAVLIGGYLLWEGSHGPGGAFQAGAVLAALAVLLTLLDRPPLAQLSWPVRRMTLGIGFCLFLVAGLVGLTGSGSFLEYPTAWAGTAIVVVESGVTLSIAATLALLFAGGRPGAVNGESGGG